MGTIYKTLILNDKISLAVIDMTDVVQKAVKYHKLTPLTSAALGRTMIASCFMASNLKNETDKLSVTVAGNGVGGHIIVSADSKLNLRGYIDNPSAELPLNAIGKLDVRNCVGKGRITVVRSTGLKEPYTGSCEIISGELAEDFSYYYTVSEQEPTAMALGVKTTGKGKVVGAGGIVMQALPGCDDETATIAEQIIKKYSNISSVIEKEGIQSILSNDFSEYNFYERPVKYKCICNNRYIDGLIKMIGKEEAYGTLNTIGKVEVECRYCDKKYTYCKEDLDKLFK